MRLFLASESPRRRELLKALAEKFTVEAAQVQEVAAESGCPVEALVRTNAVRKAHAVAALHPEDWQAAYRTQSASEAVARTFSQ